MDVLSAATLRIRIAFDVFDKIYVSFSGGKDSSVMTHLVLQEARKRGRRVGLFFVDLEAQYKLTIDHVKNIFLAYEDIIDPYWIALPLNLRNAVSQYQPQWLCWDPTRRDDWVRTPPSDAYIDPCAFPFFISGEEFEEFVVEFGEWYGGGKKTCCFVGIRAQESLNRWRTVTSRYKKQFRKYRWTTLCGRNLYNVYPIYDWKTEDIWTYFARTGDAYNALYDRMHQAGLTIHQMRICQPYGDDQRRGLYLYHIIEPETWGRVVARVNGANHGALYAKDSGNIMGMQKITLPDEHTWQSFSMMLLDSMPEKTSDHYKDKIAVFLKWYQGRGFPDGIPDDGDLDKTSPSWKRICKSLLRNDYWCKGLSFSQHKSGAYERYKKMMKKRRLEWGLI
jgi:predicted phosphoadenosine phosphosulfate sulfurtransferase